MDQAERAEIWLPPFEHPELWLADIQVNTESTIRAPMGRVVDVAKIGGMQAGPGRFTACLSDPICTWNAGTWQFETADGVLQVSKAEEAECDLSIQGLTALVYGTHDPGDLAIQGWGNPSPQVQETLRTMFPPMLPYLHEMF
jgi:predicted acetyltransferase